MVVMTDAVQPLPPSPAPPSHPAAVSRFAKGGASRCLDAFAWWLARVRTSLLVVVVAVMSGGFLALGAAYYLGAEHLQEFWLDGERNPPAIYSTLLLLTSAAIALALARQAHANRGLRRSAWFFAGLFAFMSLDEFQSFHERFNDHFHVPWQPFYAPIIAAAFVFTLRLVRESREHRPAASLWLCGCLSWGVAQVLDLIETQVFEVGDTPFEVMVVIEEGLEMAGSALFGFALLTVVRSLRGSVRRRSSAAT